MLHKAAAMELNDLNRLRKEGIFCDITLRVGAKTIRAHKNVISARSQYFLSILSGHSSESDQGELSIEEVDADILELLVEYMYTGNLTITSDNVKRLIETASFLLITKAEKVFCDFIENADNWIEYLQFGRSNSLKRLLDLLVEKAANDFLNVFSQNEFLEIEQEEFKQLVQKSKEIGQPEDLLYSFVMRWINSSHDTRIDSLNDLLELLDPSLVSPHMMHDSGMLSISSPTMAAWAATANATSTSNEPGDHILLSKRWETDCPLMIKIFSQPKYLRIRALPDGIIGGSYVCNGYYIYHQGGTSHQRRGPLSESYVYHPTNCVWNSFIPLQVARANHYSCVLNGKLFSVGGWGVYTTLSSVEFTELHTGQRGFVDPLPRDTNVKGLGVHEHSIYVLGSTDDRKNRKCINRFDEREGVWQELEPSPYRLVASSCAVIGESIYTTHPDTLQRYDIRTNDWEMIFAEDERYPQEVFAIDNTLFGLFKEHVAKFIPEDSKWEIKLTLKSLKSLKLRNFQVSTNLLFPNVNEKDI